MLVEIVDWQKNSALEQVYTERKPQFILHKEAITKKVDTYNLLYDNLFFNT